jgi:hypothetical protein
MRDRTRIHANRFSLPRAATLALAIWGTCIPAPAGAQQRPAVGLSAQRARLLVEEGSGHEGPGAADYFGFALVAADFNGDGVDDLVGGLPGNDCDFVVWDCGATLLRLGAQGVGLASSATRQIQMAGPGDPAFAELGAALAAGDFNGDDKDDLAIGMPGYHVTFDDQGAVQVHHGDASGVTSGLYLLREGDFGVPGSAIPQDRFGFAMAAGNFDGDGFDDLAVGIPGDLASKGMVTVAHGGDGGLLPFVGYVMRQGEEGLPDVAEDGEELGYALAAGDFNGDGFDDLAIGVPSEDDIGAVLVVYGSPNSLIFANHWYLGQLDLGEPAEAGDRFGEALASGDFNGDGFDDLAIGAPREDGAGGVPQDAGQVLAAYGSASGLTASNTRLWQDSLLGPGESEDSDLFGTSLVAGDFDGDGVDDLAIGARGEDDGLELDAGAVTVVMGRRPEGLTGVARVLRPGHYPIGIIPDHFQQGPGYGASLAAGDFDGNGFDDLAAGAPYREQAVAVPDIGGISVLYGQLFGDGFESHDLGEWSEAVP